MESQSRHVKGVTWFPNKMIEVGGYEYRLAIKDGYRRKISRREAAETYRWIKEGQAVARICTVERLWITKLVEACPWCGARPLVYEMDCDGWASTGTCGMSQCEGIFGLISNEEREESRLERERDEFITRNSTI